MNTQDRWARIVKWGNGSQRDASGDAGGLLARSYRAYLRDTPGVLVVSAPSE